MRCEFCKKFDFSSVTTRIDKYGAGIHMAGGSYRFPVNEWFNYCPICGEKIKKQDIIDRLNDSWGYEKFKLEE